MTEVRAKAREREQSKGDMLGGGPVQVYRGILYTSHFPPSRTDTGLEKLFPTSQAYATCSKA